MRPTKFVATFLVIALALTLLAGCAPAAAPKQEAKPAAPTPLKIGVPIPLTGAQANFGEILQKAYKMAADEINAAGGIKGQKIELVIKDIEGKPETAMAAAENMINTDKVLCLLGGYASATAYAIAQVAQKNKVPYLVDIASADRVTQQKWNYVFRFSEPSSFGLNGPLDFLEKVAKPQSVALIYENSVFGQDTTKTMADWAKAKNVKVVFNDSFNPGSVDFKPLLSKVKAGKPDVVFMVAYLTDAVLLMRQSKELDLNPKLFLAAGAGFVLPEFIAQAGDASNLVASASIWQPDLKLPGVPEFVDKWTKAHKAAPTYHAAAGYTAIYVIKDILTRAKSMSRDDITAAFKTTDMKTLYGNIKFETFDTYMNQNKPMGVMAQWIDKNLYTVWPDNVAAKKHVFPVPPWKSR